jgi:hypothetical protein
MKHFEWEPILLKSRRTGAIKQTQFMSAYGTYIAIKAQSYVIFRFNSMCLTKKLSMPDWAI